MGLSFSIPIDVAMSVVEQLKLGGTVKRGLLGVNIQPVTQKMADYLGLDKPQGALVTNVNKGSSAEKAGIQVQDVIVEFDGKHVETSASLPPLVGAVKPGSIVDLTLVRDGKTKIIKATLDGLKGDEAIAANDDVSVSKLELGFEISDLNDNEMQELDVNQGVYVKDIKKRSVLRSGLTIGSVILELGKTPVKSVKHFKKMLDDLKEGEPIVLLVKQGGGNSYIVIERE
jgi:serine protease Do